jgi:hypothetical protein
MYYKIYKIPNDELYKNINILRFSFNPFYDTIINDHTKLKSKKILAFLQKLKKQANLDYLAYNYIYPWDDIDYFANNYEVIIAYNCATNHIQGWCNIKYNDFKINEKYTYTVCVDKIVSRASPKIKYIGLLLLEFVRDICISQSYESNYINYYNTDQRYIKISIDIMYLYSLTTTINFYKKTFLTQLNDNNDTLKHVFTYIHPEKLHSSSKIFREQLISLYILHIFECNSVLNDEAIKKYNEFKPKYSAKNNNPMKELIKYDDYIDYNINRIFGSRKKLKL